MAQPFDGAISPTPHCYEIRGRAAEIARSLGSQVAGAEHLFLAMLHDGGFPVSAIRDLVDLGAAETAVLAILDTRGSGHAGPPCPRGWSATGRGLLAGRPGDGRPAAAGDRPRAPAGHDVRLQQ